MNKEKQIKEKQIKELRGILWGNPYVNIGQHQADMLAQYLHNEEYRKQSVGEWIKDNTSKFEHRYNCSVCDYRFFGIPTPHCPNCGAKMKGE